MTVMRVGSLVDAPTSAVRRALADPTVWRRTARAIGGRAEVLRAAGPAAGDGGGAGTSDEHAPLRPGDTLLLRGPAKLDPLLRGAAGYRVEAPETSSPQDGPVREGVVELVLRHPVAGTVAVRADPTGAGVLVELEWTGPRRGPASVLLRRRAIRFGELLTSIVLLQAHDTPVVVAGLLVREDAPGRDGTGGVARVLAARRGDGRSGAGRWELPGGKVELGETEPIALQRELREELGVTVEVGHRLEQEVELPGGAVLRTYRCRCEDDPQPLEHAELRWLTEDELPEVDWLDGDRVLLPAVASELRRRPRRWSGAGAGGR